MKKRPVLYQQVHDSLERRIYGREFKYQTAIPPISELVREYAVSIITIRSALKLLEQEGMITISQGRPAMVNLDNRDESIEVTYRDWIARHKKAIVDVLSVQQYCVPAMVAFACSRASASDILELREFVKNINFAEMTTDQFCPTWNSFIFILTKNLNNQILSQIMAHNSSYIQPAFLYLNCSKYAALRTTYVDYLYSFIEKFITAYEQHDTRNIYVLIKEFFRRHISFFLHLTACIPPVDEEDQAFPFVWTPYRNASLAKSSVAMDLIRRIGKGEFKPGSKLPAEAALCEEYQVSLTTIRQALQKLNQGDLVRTINGTGTIVCLPKPGEKKIWKTIGDLQLNCQQYLEIMQIFAVCAYPVASMTVPIFPSDAIERLNFLVQKPPDPNNLCPPSFVINAIAEHCPIEAIRSTHKMLEAYLFVLSHKLQQSLEHPEDVPRNDLSEISDAAISALYNKDVIVFTKANIDIIHELYSRVAHICVLRNFPVNVPLPENEQRYYSDK